MHRYDKTLPRAAERILALAERQQHHRLALEDNGVRANVVAQQTGVWLGFLVAMSSIGGGIYLAAIGRESSGLTAILGALAVGVFVYGRTKQRSDLDSKR